VDISEEYVHKMKTSSEHFSGSGMLTNSHTYFAGLHKASRQICFVIWLRWIQ